MRPPVRCHFFDENGNPLQSGCRNRSDECSFIHPDNPLWNTAKIPNRLSGGRGRGRPNTSFAGRSREPPTGPRHGVSSPPTTSSWNTAAWSTPAPASATSDVEPSTSGWATESKGWDSAWGSSSNSWGKSPTQGDAAEKSGDGAWGSGVGASWGSTGGSAWGNASPTVNAYPTIDASPDASSIVNASRTNDETPDPTTPIRAPSPRDRESESASSAPVIPNTTPQPCHVDRSPSRMGSPMVIGDPTQSSGRHEIRKEVIKLLDRAVRLKLGFDQIKATATHWSNTRLAFINRSGVGKAAQDILDKLEEEQAQSFKSLKDDLHEAVSQLSELPDAFDPAFAEFDPDWNETGLMQYTIDLRLWIEGIQKHLIALARRRLESIETRPPSKRPRLESPEISEKPPTKQSEVAERLAGLDEQLEQIVDVMTYLTTEPFLDDLPDWVDAKLAEAWERESLEESSFELLSQRTSAVKDVIEKETQRAQSLEIHDGRVKQLSVKGDQSCESFKQLRERISKAKESDQECSARLDQVSEGLKALFVQPPVPPPPTFDDMADIVYETVGALVDRDAVQLLNALREEYREKLTESHERIYSSLWKKMEPALALTEGAYAWMESSTS